MDSTGANGTTGNVVQSPLYYGFDAFCGEVFFNVSLLVDNTWPQFSQCFLDTVLVWVSCGFFWLASSCYVYQDMTSPDIRPSLPLSCLNASKLAAAALMTQYERLRGITTSSVSFIFWFVKMMVDIVPTYTLFMMKVYDSNVFKFVMSMAVYVLVVAMVVLYSFAERVRLEKQGYVHLEKSPCPETRASFLNQITFFWLTKLLSLGYKRDLTADDLWDLNPRDQCSTLVPTFENFWRDEVERCTAKGRPQPLNAPSCEESGTDNNGMVEKGSSVTNGTRSRATVETTTANGMQRGKEEEGKSRSNERLPLRKYYRPSQGSPSYTDEVSDASPMNTYGFTGRPSLFRVLWRQFRTDILITVTQKMISDLSLLGGPVILGLLLDFVKTREPGTEWMGFVLCLGLAVFGTSKAIFYSTSMYRSWLLGQHVKSILITAVFNKALRLSNETKKRYRQGEIVNLQSVDAQHVQLFLVKSFCASTTPIHIVLSIILIYFYVGASAFTGFAILLLLTPINTCIAVYQRKFQETNLKFKDERVKLVNEILNGIQVLKLYAWEPSFEKRVASIRLKEIAYLLKIALLYLCSGLCWNIAPFLMTLGTFATFVLSNPDSSLDPSKVFVTLALFQILRLPMDLLASLIIFTVQAHVSLKRINKFLVADEMDLQNVRYVKDSPFAISIEQASFSWGNTPTPNLRNIQLQVSEGCLMAVVGHVGAGKSSLINAILGEMDKHTGTVTVKGSIAYVAQQAWIQNATIRDNILFGKPFDKHRYRQVIRACELERDLEILSAGDMTEIGEKGINLSGGQKQRVSLARAVYSDNDVFLLDDPLSAVDSHVGKAIFENVIGPNGLMQKKTRVLVTHGVHWLPLVDEVVVLSDGKVSEVGSYTALVQHDGPFAQFLKTYFSQDVDSDQDDPEILEMKQTILGQVESLTSDASATSGDDSRGRYLRKGRRKKDSSSSERSRSISRSEVVDTVAEMEPCAAATSFKGDLTTVEKLETGRVPWRVYWTYMKAAGPLPFTAALFCYGAFNAIAVIANFWLSWWTVDPLLTDRTQWGSEAFVELNDSYLLNFGLMGVAQFVLILIHNYLYWTRVVYAGQTLHDTLVQRLFHAPMSFFDTTPLGRIMSRVSGDIEVVDNLLPLNFRDLLTLGVITVSTLVVISIQTPPLLGLLLPVVVLFLFVQRFYLPTSRQVKRMEAVTRSPIFNHFSESLTGAATIRAFQATPWFIAETKLRVDQNQIFQYVTAAALRWLQVNLDTLANIVVSAAGMFPLLSPDVNGGSLGLSVAYGLQMCGTLHYMMLLVSEFETNIVSVERLHEYSHIDTEADRINVHRRPPPSWPTKGAIALDNYQTRYRPGLDLVLKGVTCQIEAGEKVGIVGRTGAGKSSFTLSLFRILEAAGGAILIDGINIADIGLHDLRSGLTILPQDPVLFSGSLRSNLDPFDQYSDERIWQALERAHLKTFVTRLPTGLLYECGEQGTNLSVGQKQLVCLARTLLRHTKVLILDEATAAVDLETDALIQKTVRLAFRSCTIVTIAHRLNTILDYDRILVMDEGLIKEFDSPDNLLNDPSTLFYSMARDAGLV